MKTPTANFITGLMAYSYPLPVTRQDKGGYKAIFKLKSRAVDDM